jgi:hypothetical protein
LASLSETLTRENDERPKKAIGGDRVVLRPTRDFGAFAILPAPLPGPAKRRPDDRGAKRDREPGLH